MIIKVLLFMKDMQTETCDAPNKIISVETILKTSNKIHAIDPYFQLQAKFFPYRCFNHTI